MIKKFTYNDRRKRDGAMNSCAPLSTGTGWEHVHCLTSFSLSRDGKLPLQCFSFGLSYMGIYIYMCVPCVWNSAKNGNSSFFFLLEERRRGNNREKSRTIICIVSYSISKILFGSSLVSNLV